jgi:hypothetical protein
MKSRLLGGIGMALASTLAIAPLASTTVREPQTVAPTVIQKGKGKGRGKPVADLSLRRGKYVPGGKKPNCKGTYPRNIAQVWNMNEQHSAWAKKKFGAQA